jgi:enoyl-CoA hydratase
VAIDGRHGRVNARILGIVARSGSDRPVSEMDGRQKVQQAEIADRGDGTPVRVAIEGGVATVSFCRPHRANSLRLRDFETLHDELLRLQANDAVRCVILTGSGATFCAGLDLHDLTGIAAMSPDRILAVLDEVVRPIVTLTRMTVPVIAAVNGPAAGGGMALALASDIVIAGESGSFLAPLTRLGLSGGDVGLSWMLPRLVGLARAKDLLLTGRVISAGEAERIGLISRSVEDDQLAPEARGLARSLAQAAHATAATKRVLQMNVDASSIEDAIRVENAHQSLLLAGGAGQPRQPARDSSAGQDGPGAGQAHD